MGQATVNLQNLGQKVSTSNPLPVLAVAPTSASTAGYSAAASKTRPNDTTAYAALDVIAESDSAGTVWTFTGVGPSGGGKVIVDAMTLEIDIASIPSGMGAFRLHLYSTSPTAINDNTAFNLPSGDRAKYLGYVETPTPIDLGATLWSETESMSFPVRKQVTLASSTVYGILQTVAAFTPAAQTVKSVTLHSVGV
jgi:hypothetical protein